MSIIALRSIHDNLVRENSEKVGAKRTVTEMIKDNKERTKDLNLEQQNASDAILLVQRFSEGIQSGVVNRFEDLLTRGVRQIFNKQYKVSIEFEHGKANNVQADFFITLPNGKKVSLAKGEGGGMRDVISVLQRILYLVLDPTQPTKILLLDESLKALDVGRAPAAFTFVKNLCNELDIQTIFITHQQAATEIEDGMKVIPIGGSSVQ